MKYSKYHLLTFTVILVMTVFFFGFKIKKDNDPEIHMQTGVFVSDMDRSFDFYTKVIGMVKTGSFHVSPGLADSAGFTDKAIDVIELKLTNEPGAHDYRIARIKDDQRPPVDNKIQPGIRYISISVQNITPYLKRLREHNIKLWSKDPLPVGDKTVLIFSDPDGAMIEIVGAKLN